MKLLVSSWTARFLLKEKKSEEKWLPPSVAQLLLHCSSELCKLELGDLSQVSEALLACG